MRIEREIIGRLFPTNPVFCIGQLLDGHTGPLRETTGIGRLDQIVAAVTAEGRHLPMEALDRWRAEGFLTTASEGAPSRPRPGVIGLAVQPLTGMALIVPLVAHRAAEWRISPPLPERHEQITELLQRVSQHDALATGRDPTPRLPETLAAEVSTPFPLTTEGESMDVAMLLATLSAHRSSGGEPPLPLLGAACAVVSAEGGRIAPVGSVLPKLRAFQRELGTGTLLVRASEDAVAAAFDRWFDEVWAIESVAELADRLGTVGLLQALRDRAPLDAANGERLLARLRVMAETERAHRKVVDLGQRLLRVTWCAGVPKHMRREPRSHLAGSLRHLGLYAEAMRHAEAWSIEAHADPHASHEDVARADLEWASSLFDPWRLERAIEVLAPWLEHMERDPRALGARIRSHILNTAARALSHLNRDGWQQLFERSLGLQAQESPGDLPRTINYMAQALMRANRLDEAERLLADDLSGADPYRAHCHAELARRRGCSWTCEHLEAGGPTPGSANHALGFYLQATARQLPEPERAAERFARAEAAFLADASDTEPSNVLWVLAHSMALAAAVARVDLGAASAAIARLQASLDQPGLEALRAHLAPHLPADGTSSVEPLLRHLPWL